MHICQILGHALEVDGGTLAIARLADERYASLEDMDGLVTAMRATGTGIDLFTFRQRIPDVTPRYDYWHEPDPVAAIPVTTKDAWLSTIGKKGRNMLKKAAKAGIEIRPSAFDEPFLRGMHAIFNESPIRQGKPFTHYGKSIDVLRDEFARFLFRETIIGAYFRDELIGFIYLADNGSALQLGQIISAIAHRDKATNNALIAAGVDACLDRRVPYLAYAEWSTGSLGDFKRHNGFQRLDLPRYYVPASFKGKLALQLGLHRGLRGVLPESVTDRFVALRRRWRAARLAQPSSEPTYPHY